MLKFYLHDAATAVAGTLPGASAVTGTAFTVTASGAGTNRNMDASIGVAQASGALTTNATTTSQSGFIRRFVSPALAAQVLDGTGLTWTLVLGASESNTSSNFTISFSLALWRPSTGALLAYFDPGTPVATVTTTAEASYTTTVGAFPSPSMSIASGDILIVEIYRRFGAQGMATSYTNTVFYDGTTEGSTTSNAAYLLAPFDIALQDAARRSLVWDSRRVARNSLLRR